MARLRCAGLLLALLLPACGGADGPPALARPSSTSPSASFAAPVPSPSTSPERVETPEEKAARRAETLQALTVAPPPVVRDEEIPSIETPTPDKPLFGHLGMAGVQEVYDAATEVIDLMLRTPALLDWERAKTVEDFAPLRRTLHSDLAPLFNSGVEAFVGSAANGAAVAGPDTPEVQQAVNDLLALVFVFVVQPTAPVASADQGAVTGTMAGLGGEGAGAYGLLRITDGTVYDIDPAADSAIVSVPYVLEIQGVDEQGRPQTFDVERTEVLLVMKRTAGRWLLSEYQTGPRTIVARPRA